MTVCGNNLGGFPGKFIGEKIFGGFFGWIKALNNSVFPRNRI
jgi:hypothetical protein